MAIIKCPECGQQISDKAPVCPHCGVEITGKITRCTQCGEVYFSNLDYCPKCHHATYVSKQVEAPDETKQKQEHHPTSQQTTSTTTIPPIPPISKPTETNDRQKDLKPKKRKTIIYIVALCIALLISGIVFYCSNSAKIKKENEAYAFALKSDDVQVLQTYLNNKDMAGEYGQF